MFSLRRYGRILVRSDRGEISSGKEQYRGMLTKVFGVENRAVFGGGHIEAVLFAQCGYCVFQNAGLTSDVLYNIVLEARRLGKHKK